MGRNFWDPMDIERPNVNVIKFLLCQIGFISACWAGFLWSTGAADLPPMWLDIALYTYASQCCKGHQPCEA